MSRAWWYTSVIPATPELFIVGGQPMQKLARPCLRNNKKKCKKKGLVAWLQR
jgi:hypothetical protein